MVQFWLTGNAAERYRPENKGRSRDDSGRKRSACQILPLRAPGRLRNSGKNRHMPITNTVLLKARFTSGLKGLASTQLESYRPSAKGKNCQTCGSQKPGTSELPHSLCRDVMLRELLLRQPPGRPLGRVASAEPEERLISAQPAHCHGAFDAGMPQRSLAALLHITPPASPPPPMQGRCQGM